MDSIEAPVEVLATETEKVRGGFLPIKKEFLLQVEETIEEEQPQQKNEEDGDGQPRKKKFKGMDKERRKKMANAKKEILKHEIRLCPSVFMPNRTCKFGDKCRNLHSIEEFMKSKPEDLGKTCVNFDALGTCPYGVACRFASAHTNENDYSQITKDPNPLYKPTLNSQSLDIQMAIRKHTYDFSKTEEACKKYPNISKDAPPVGCMEREKLKFDMRSLKGKTYLAPLTTVGNLPFRRLCVDLGCNITCGEMAVATNFLTSSGPNEWPLLKRHPSEKIFGVQLAGGYPDSLGRTAQMICENMDVDFIDLNLGCPLDLINEKGGGCSLANKSNKLIQVVQTLQDVMGEVPLTLKMRYGMKIGEQTAHHVMKKVVETCPPQMFTLHPRSREQRYTKEADWTYVPKCLTAINKKVPLWVCGDVFSQQDYYHKLETNDIDGIMLGRAPLIKPWLFTEIKEKRDWDISATERLDMIGKFCNYGLEHWGSDSTGVELTRRFLLEYMSFQYRYVPLGLLERIPQKMNEKPPAFCGRSDLETLLASKRSSDWVKISEMFLGKTPEGFLFVPKHKANAY